MRILFLSTTAQPETWLGPLGAALPDDEIMVYPELGDPATIECAIVAVPPPGVLTGLPKLRLIQSLWVGVESLLRDPTLPKDVPLARLVDPGMTGTMTETVLQHVLNAHREYEGYRAQQRGGIWRHLPQVRAQDRRVGFLGLGELGTAAARTLVGLNFAVAGWSRRPQELAGIATFAGPDGLRPFLARTDILVCLLPLTAETRGIINADILAALDSGQLGRAVLDVFNTEPLPPDHPYWTHPRIVITPHVAAETDPATAVSQVVENLRRLRAGEPLRNVVDRAAGY